jgi:hypothetical protein
MCLSFDLQNKLKSLGVVGYFFVRQKRVPTSMFQAVSVGIDNTSGYILPKINYNFSSYRYESLTDSVGKLTRGINSRLVMHSGKKTMGLISLDPMVNPQIRSQLIWNNYTLKYNCEGVGKLIDSSNRHIV